MSVSPDVSALLPDDELPLPAGRAPVRRPVAGLAIAFCLGIGLGLELPIAPLSLLAIGGVFTLLAALWLRHTLADFLLACGVVCAGWAHATLTAHSPSAREIPALLVRPAEYVSVIGEVRDAPVGQRDERTGEMIWSFPLRLEGLHRITIWQRAVGDIDSRLRLASSGVPPRFGERWLFTGLLAPRTRWRAGGEVPAGYRLIADGGSSRRLAEAGWSVYAICLRTRTACADLLGRGLDKFPEQAGLLRAMMLGTREEMDEALYRDFSVTGTLHIIAVSGTHVAVIALLLIGLLRAGGVTQPHWFFFLAPLLTLYTLMTGLAPSAIRACIMALLFWMAPFLQRRPDGLLALAWSAILILAWDPTQWLDLGFILSYAAVLGLILLYPPLAACTQRWLQADPWRLQAEPRTRRGLRTATRHVVLLTLTSVAACAATEPITARYFNLISPVALLANLAVVPAAGLMMVLGCLALIGGAVWLPLAEIFNSANLLIISFIMRCTEWSAAVPGGHFFIRSPGWPAITAYYAMLALFLLGNRRLRQVLLAVTIMLVGLLAWRLATDQSLAIHVWRLGGTTVTLMDAPGGDKLLVNTGPRFVTRDLLRRIHAEGVGSLRALVLTRGTSDRSGGTAELLRQLPVHELWTVRGSAALEIQSLAQRQNIVTYPLEQGQRMALHDGVMWEVLHPPSDLRTRYAEERTPVFRLMRGSLAVLCLNDTGAGVLTRLAISPKQPIHHTIVTENAGALQSEWLARLAAHDVIVPASALREVQERQTAVEQQGLRVWRMEEGDTLHIYWPECGKQTPERKISLCPSKPIVPTTF